MRGTINKSLETKIVLFCLVTMLLPSAMAFAQSSQNSNQNDWPQWRGPNRDDISTETGLLKRWPEEGPKRIWTFEEGGDGYAGFAIVNGKLFTLGAVGDREFALCLDANTGQQIWRTDIDTRFKNRWGDGPRNTPSVDGDSVYVMSAKGTLKCLGVDDGAEKWSASLTQDFGGKVPYWGYSESPLVDGDKVLCTPGGSQGAMVALDKKTGQKIWQSRTFTDDCHYSSIVPANFDGKKQYVQLVPRAVVGIDAENGAVLWRQAWRGRTAVIPTPIVGENSVYVSSGYGVGSMMVDIRDSGAKQRWFSKKLKNHHGGVIALDGHFYGYSDGIGWVCQSGETGDLVWSEKKAFKKGAIAYADGRFYLLEEKTGNVALIEASTDGWKEMGRFKLEPQSENRAPDGAIWVHPVISNGKLYLRDQEFISCFDIKG